MTPPGLMVSVPCCSIAACSLYAYLALAVPCCALPWEAKRRKHKRRVPAVSVSTPRTYTTPRRRQWDVGAVEARYPCLVPCGSVSARSYSNPGTGSYSTVAPRLWCLSLSLSRCKLWSPPRSPQLAAEQLNRKPRNTGTGIGTGTTGAPLQGPGRMRCRTRSFAIGLFALACNVSRRGGLQQPLLSLVLSLLFSLVTRTHIASPSASPEGRDRSSSIPRPRVTTESYHSLVKAKEHRLEHSPACQPPSRIIGGGNIESASFGNLHSAPMVLFLAGPHIGPRKKRPRISRRAGPNPIETHWCAR